MRVATRPPRLARLASNPSSAALATLHLNRFPLQLSSLSRRVPILTAEDTSADATNAHHLENPVGPRRTRRAWPLASLDHVDAGKGHYCV